MCEKTPNQIGLLFEPFERRDDMRGEFVARFTAEMLQVMLFDRRPDLLIGIELWAIRGQLFQLDDALIFRMQKGLDGLAAMDRRPIPDPRHRRRRGVPHLSQQPHHVVALIAALLNLIAQVSGLR